MKRLIQIIILLALAVGMTGCATPYMIDRGHDAADIFTASVGWGAGAKARVGPINAGVFGNSDRAGLRAGRGFTSRQISPSTAEMVEVTTPLPVFPGLHGDGFGLHSLEKCDEPCFEFERRNKGYQGFGIIVPFIMTHMASPAPYYTQIEIAGGLIVTARLGFNPGELLDFFLGWFGIDIYNDDFETKKQQEKSDKPVKVQPKPGASQ